MWQKLSLLLTGIALLLVLPASSAGSPRDAAPSLVVWADNGGTPFVSDGPGIVTVSPNADGDNDVAAIHYRVSVRSIVHFAVTRHGATVVALPSRAALPGEHLYRWQPPARPVPAAYVLHVDTQSAHRTIVVHAQGVDAAAGRAAYHPGDTARLAVSTDARRVRVQVLRITGAAPITRRNDRIQGTVIGRSFLVTWPTHRDRPHSLAVPLGRWPSGVYFVRLRADDDRVGYAPFLLRPHRLGRSRVAVVMPTNTWQAYNFYDRDGDGRGDTWYADWRRRTTHLGRPYLSRGVPAHFNTYDLPFLRWAARRKLHADYLSDTDAASISGDELARLYDLVVFPGHTEYVTRSEYDNIERFRDLGGNLAWLSANNFFWKVVRHGPVLERVATWRNLGRPEASLIGAQYRANDEGQRRAPMVVDNGASWFFRGTGLAAGNSFGRFGIEIDARAPSSPHQTTVLASARLFAAENDAEMTYYALPNGAKVFAAGAFTLAGLADSRVGRRLLDNLFDHLEKP